MSRIVFFHLLNDYSGSPKVLKLLLDNLADERCRVDLVTSRGGVLDNLIPCGNIRRISYRYRFSTHPGVTLLRYFLIQVYTFFLAFKYRTDRDSIFYINTLLPVGPALAGRLMGKRVVYHYHENAQAKGLFYRMLGWCMERIASEIICVSRYQRSFLRRKEGVHIIPNALPQAFTARIHPNIEQAFERKNVLMLSSLKLYKGTLGFVALARQLPQFEFTLVINDTQENIQVFLKDYVDAITLNLHIHPRQNDVVSFYEQASIVLNLSDPRLVVETFGLTALEAMTAGLPVIVPTVGGIAEMVEDGISGYKIDVQDLGQIRERIQEMLSDKELYRSLAKNAWESSLKYNEKEMTDAISALLDLN